MEERFRDWKFPRFRKDGMTKWGWKCQYHNKLKVGKYTDIGAFSYLNAKYGIELQDSVQIGSHSSLYSVSTIDNKKGKILIKKNACIGSHCVVMPGVKIGENSVIGAFSFVIDDIPDNVLAFGIPAKVKRKLSKRHK